MGLYVRPTPARTYYLNESSVHLVTSIISLNSDQVLSYFAHTLPSVCTPGKLFQYFTRRTWWRGGNFHLRHPSTSPASLNFRPFRTSLYCLLTFNPKWQLISHNHSTSHKSWHWQLKELKKISTQSTMWEDTWVDGVIYRPSLSHSMKKCGQHLSPLPASPHPPPSNANWSDQYLWG